ncbi:MAG: histidinol-phosphatase HisJ family protein [Ruminococcaceae bacterium]|nr:histidinol-phosphatase HisJ family protein [Oscillospiraceae bacterium]
MKRPIVDYHIHTEYSFDWSTLLPGRVFDICDGALKNGVTQIAITDHLDVNTVYSGELIMLDTKQVREDVMRAKKAYEGRLDIIYGIELGQPHQVPQFASEILKNNKYEYVIGSYHNNIDVCDFSLIDYQNTPHETLIRYYENYLDETADHIKWCVGRISTLGHLGYPIRYFMRNNLTELVNPYDEKYMKRMKYIFELLIKHEIALEVNTSGWRQGMNNSMALDGMVQCYVDMGGKLITIGSDSHGAHFIGSDIEREYDILKKLGVREITTFVNGVRGSFEL